MGNEINFLWPLRILRRMAIFCLSIFVLSSCATVKKSREVSSSEQTHLDKSIVKNDKTKQVVIEEQVLTPVLTKPDTAGFKGWFSSSDSSGYSQEVESNGQKIKTTVKPVKDKDGKTTGYNVNTEAIKKAETILAPVNKKTTISSSDKSETKNDVTDIKKEKTKTVNKSSFRFNLAGTLAVVGIVAVVLVFLYFVFKKRITK